MSELLPCPHCGGEASMQEQPPHTHAFVNMPDHPGSWTIECPACGNGMINDTRDEVVARWNRRAALQAAPEREPLTDTYVQVVPDHCDRIVWRNDYYHLPLRTPPTSATVEAATVERIAALLHEEATDEPWTVAGVEHNGPDRGYYRKIARKVVALASQPAQPQAEAQAGETRGIKPNWKAMYESQLHATLEQADECDRLRNQLRAANDREKLKDQAIDRLIATEDELRAQLAAQDRLDEAAVEYCPANDCNNKGWYVMPNRNTGEPEQVQCEFCYTHPNSAFNRALRNKADAQERE